ncbi:hypothetical protein MO973_06950 [Paenibacillus sp. TRM 82003]|nr:hypothetical protein [Paenibacillus sp. TRM 82003]
MGKTVCTKVLCELKDLLGERAASDVVSAFVKASDEDLIELRNALESMLHACAPTPSIPPYAGHGDGAFAEEAVWIAER